MVVVMLFHVGEVTHQCHLDCTLASFAHAADVALKTVVFVDDLETRLLEERLEGWHGNVELHFYAREQRRKFFVDFAVECPDFGGAVFAVGREQVAELVQERVDFASETALERLENFMQKLGEGLVPFEVPNGDRFGEHAVVRLLEFLAGANPFALVALAVVTRNKDQYIESFGILAGNALHLLDAQSSWTLWCILQVRAHRGGTFFTQSAKHLLRNTIKYTDDFYGAIWVVKVRNVERKIGQ